MEKQTMLQMLQQRAGALTLQGRNELLGRYRLHLTEEQALALARREGEALLDSGRIEFGQGVMDKLLYAFCDSPYLEQENLVETLCALADTFYYYKNESEGMLSDDELVELMASAFNGPAQGSLEYMAEASLGDVVRQRKR